MRCVESAVIQLSTLSSEALETLRQALTCDDVTARIAAARALLDHLRHTGADTAPAREVDVGSFDRIAAKLQHALDVAGIQSTQPETTGEFIARTGRQALAEAGVDAESGLESGLDYPDWQSVQ